MPVLIKEVPPSVAPMDLLLLADPSVEKINGYLPASRCFVACSAEATVGVCVVTPLGQDAYELMSIAVAPDHQQAGVGTQLLKHTIEAARKLGARRLEVGTGSFGYQLTFYQRHGFRITSIDRDFFVRNYAEPIFEAGTQLRDMLRLTLEL